MSGKQARRLRKDLTRRAGAQAGLLPTALREKLDKARDDRDKELARH